MVRLLCRILGHQYGPETGGIFSEWATIQWADGRKTDVPATTHERMYRVCGRCGSMKVREGL